MHPPLSGWGKFETDEWELYDLPTDRAQSKNVAAQEPARLEELKSLWFYYAGIYNGLPLDDRTAHRADPGRAATRHPDRATGTSTTPIARPFPSSPES